MNYDFETLIDRGNQGAAKWELMKAQAPDVPKGVVPLSVADMEFVNAPEIRAALHRFLDEGVLGYGCMTDRYRAAVCGWMQRRHAFPAQPEWIVPSPGVVPALYYAVRACTAPGDGVIVPTPVYYPFFAAVEKNGRRVVRCPLINRGERYEFDFDALEAAARQRENTLLLLCSPHNPVGRVWTERELSRLSDICLEHHVFVVADEIHHDLILPGHRHTVYAGLSAAAADNCILCTAPSKTFNIAGLQASNILVPNAAVRARLEAEMGKSGAGELNVMGGVACEAAYNEGAAWLDALLLKIQENADLCKGFLADNVPGVRAYPLEGTYLQWWDCRGLGLPQEKLIALLEGEALLFSDDGALFGPEGAGFVRVNLACPTRVLEAVLSRVRDAVCRAAQ